MNGAMHRSETAVRLGSAVRWHGLLHRVALRALMGRADLLVITSRHEADPMVLLEAAIAGVPSVGTAVSHLPERAADDSRRVAIARSAQRRALAIDADFTALAFERHYAELLVDFVPTGDPFAGPVRSLCD